MGQPHPKINRKGRRVDFLRLGETLRQSTLCLTKMSRMPQIVAQTRYSWKQVLVSAYTTVSCIGGGRGIRTPGTLSSSTVFKTAAFNHSAIPPIPSYMDFEGDLILPKLVARIFSHD